jgi:hypothetical protein
MWGNVVSGRHRIGKITHSKQNGCQYLPVDSSPVCLRRSNNVAGTLPQADWYFPDAVNGLRVEFEIQEMPRDAARHSDRCQLHH